MPNFDRSRPAPVDLLLRRNGGSAQVCEAADDAIEQLYAHYREELHMHARRLLGSSDLAEDAVQQAFSNTIVAVRRGVHIDHAARWLHTSVRNACIDYLREQQMLSLKEAEEIPAESHPADVVDAQEQVEAIRHAVGQLPDHLRAALVLTDVHGFSYKEVATQMHKSVGSVRQLIFRARRHVREMTGGGGLALVLPVRAWISSFGERVLGWVAQTAAPVGGVLLVTVAVTVQLELDRPPPAVGVHRSGAIHDVRARLAGPRTTRTNDPRSSPQKGIPSGSSNESQAGAPFRDQSNRVGESGINPSPPMRADRRRGSKRADQPESFAANPAGTVSGGAWGSSPPIAEPPTEIFRPASPDPPVERTDPQASQGHEGGPGGDSPGGSVGPETVAEHANRIGSSVGVPTKETDRSERPGPVSSSAALPKRP